MLGLARLSPSISKFLIDTYCQLGEGEGGSSKAHFGSQEGGGLQRGPKNSHIIFEGVLWFGLVDRTDFPWDFKFLSLENQLTLYIFHKICMLEYLDRKFYKFWPLSCEICDRMLWIAGIWRSTKCLTMACGWRVWDTIVGQKVGSA